MNCRRNDLASQTGTEGRRRAWMGAGAAVTLACLVMPAAQAQDEEHKAGLKRTYIALTSSGHGQLESNGVLVEPAQPSPKERIVAINTHPKNRNNFEYFIGDQLASRGYRVIEVNDYGPETSPEALLPGIAAAVRYARGLPGVQHVVLVGHRGGGPVLSFYQEIAEKGPPPASSPTVCIPASRAIWPTCPRPMRCWSLRPISAPPTATSRSIRR